VNRKSSILVFANGVFENPINIAAEDDVNGLEVVGKDQIGYSREINPVGEKYILDHCRTDGPKPPPIDHLGIDDSFETGSVIRYFYQGKWLQLMGSD
jgi:hypothetical protein